MLYETLTGEKVEGRYDPATEFIQDLPSEVDKIIDACVATNPKKRTKSANQLIASLQAVLTEAELKEQARILQEAKQAQREAVKLAKRKAKEAQREAAKARTSQEAIQQLESSPFIQLISKHRSLVAIILVFLVLLPIGIRQSSIFGELKSRLKVPDEISAPKSGSKPLEKTSAQKSASNASNYAALEMRLNNESALILDQSVREQLKIDADSGDSTAQALMAFCLAAGRGGFVVDHPQALIYAQQSVKAENPGGMNNLGNMYAAGRGGLAKNDVEAVKWHRKSAEAGNSAGMNALGFMYRSGRGGLLKDEVEAVKWFRKSAEAGNSAGMFNLGLMYKNGRGGLVKDEVEAVKWYRKSAEAGNSVGMCNLGLIYRNGLGGIAQDEVEAVKWFRKSAEARNTFGMFNLGLMYINGRGGLPKDEVEAVMWYRKAAKLGDKDAQTALNRLGVSE
jgi:TPR repeat protein